MINFTPEEHAWASKAAMRLRFVQADFSDRPAEERRSTWYSLISKPPVGGFFLV